MSLLRSVKKKHPGVFISIRSTSNLQDVLQVGVYDEVKGLVPFWVDVVVYVLGPLPALRG